MTSSTSTSTAPVLRRPRDYQWCWSSAADPSVVYDELWTKYTDIENEIIEDALNQSKTRVEIDGHFIINLEILEQYDTVDSSNRHPVKRVKVEVHRHIAQFHRERFSLPVVLATSTSSSEAKQDTHVFCHLRNHGIVTAYYLSCENKGKTITDVVEEAAQGIIAEGTILDNRCQAEWLAQQLRNVKHLGTNVYVIEEMYMLPNIPSEIGQSCIHLYSRESFWYKLINRELRDDHTATVEQVRTIGPFCFLLKQYLLRNPSYNIETVYRSLNLDDEDRQKFMQQSLWFSAFTSTSKNRQLAELYGGNTLLIINLYECSMWTMGRKDAVDCATEITDYSHFPEEEEVLIWPGNKFDFIKHEHDVTNKKYVIYLSAALTNAEDFY